MTMKKLRDIPLQLKINFDPMNDLKYHCHII